MSTELAPARARRPSRGRGALAVVLACLGVVALAALYVQFGDAVNPRAYTVAARGRAGDHAGTVPAPADANADSVAPLARVTKVPDGRGEPIGWP